VSLNQKGRGEKWIESHRDSVSDAFLLSQRCGERSGAEVICLLRRCGSVTLDKVHTEPNEEDHF